MSKPIYQDGTAILQGRKIVAFITDNKEEVTFIEGTNKVATVSRDLVEHVYQSLQGKTNNEN